MNQSSETISNKVESIKNEASLEENKNSSEPIVNNSNSNNNNSNNNNSKPVENKAVTISTNNISNNGVATPISPNTLANSGQATMRYISFIPAPAAIATQAFTTQQQQQQQQQHPHMELNVTQNTASISPQQWTTNKDGQLQALPAAAYMPSSYQINQYDPQYTTYQNIGYPNYPNYSNMVPVEYSYGPTPPINNDHSHHNNNSHSGQYENGMGMNTYIQYIPNDHQHSYADANAYQVSSNIYTPYKNVNLAAINSRSFNSHKHNKYTNDSSVSSGKSYSTKADGSFQSNSKNSSKALANVEEINGTSKQPHKWSDIVSGKNNENPIDNQNQASTSGEMNKENYDQENDSNENFNYYNYNENYTNKKSHSKQHASNNNFTKSVYNSTNSNSNMDSTNYINSNGNNGKFHGKRQPEFYTGYGVNNNYGYNQYGLDGKLLIISLVSKIIFLKVVSHWSKNRK